jgi:hypothetical protein
MKKTSRLWLAVLAVSLALLGACVKEKPMSNTPEYRAAHGIVEGRANTLRVGDSAFQLPPGAVFDVYTADAIQPGRADKLTLFISVDRLLNPAPRAGAIAKGDGYVVRTEISHRGLAAEGFGHEVDPKTLHGPAARQDLGLLEFVRATPPPTAYHADRVYRPIHQEGDRRDVEIFCGLAWPNDPARISGLCRTAYHTPSGLLVQSYFDYDLLRHWPVVAREVGERVSQYQLKRQASRQRPPARAPGVSRLSIHSA